jgi:uncharacterized protein (TIGR00255 family)
MICSMTGYAAHTREVARASLSIEIKSVNSRFLDLGFRLPEDLRGLEPVLRERVAARIQRGKIECRVMVAPAPGSTPRLALNEPLLAALAEASRAARTAIPEAQPLTV